MSNGNNEQIHDYNGFVILFITRPFLHYNVIFRVIAYINGE